MARVTATEVKEIINTTIADDSLAPFITAANLIVTKKLGSLSGLSTALLKEIERWLAAHFVSIGSSVTGIKSDVKYRKTGDSAVSYQNNSLPKNVDLNLLSTTVYGIQAMILDTTGTLANLGKKRASLNVFDVINTD